MSDVVIEEDWSIIFMFSILCLSVLCTLVHLCLNLGYNFGKKKFFHSVLVFSSCWLDYESFESYICFLSLFP